MPSFNQMPDEPQPFGFKVSWLALKTSDPAAVLDALELGEVTPANWESGLAPVDGSDPWGLRIATSRRLGLGCKRFAALSHCRNSS